MNIYNSCEEAIDNCLKSKTFTVAHLFSTQNTMGIHTHDCHEIYYSVSGGRQFLIESRLYSVKPGDVFFISQFESHHLTQIDKETHERFVISIHPEYLTSLCTEHTDLNHCFLNQNPQNGHKISLTAEEQHRFFFYMDALKNCHNYGADIMMQSIFSLFMVYMNKRFIKFDDSQSYDSIHSSNDKIRSILSYINQHLEEEMTIDQLAKTFYMSPSYLCRIFKNATGTTIIEYIRSRRISYSKQLLSTGYSIENVVAKCGFNDYSAFYRAFTKYTDISPKKYAQLANENQKT